MLFLPDLATDTFIDFRAFLSAAREGRLKDMPRYQDVAAVGGSLRASADAYKTFYFVSHRWEDPSDPDPTRWQFDALTQFAVELEAQGGPPSCFWFDFSSLPQGARSPEEELIFSQGLGRLNALSIACDTIVLVSGSSDPFVDFAVQLKRGWILCEVLVAYRCSRWKWWFHQGDGEVFAASRARTTHFNHIIEASLRGMPVHDVGDLLAWLETEGVTCTNKAQLPYLASRMVTFSFDINRQSGAAPPDLREGITHRLSDEEVARYFIDANGRSPYFPTKVFVFSRRSEGGYDVSVHASPGATSP